jgi:hypothetical protein
MHNFYTFEIAVRALCLHTQTLVSWHVLYIYRHEQHAPNLSMSRTFATVNHRIITVFTFYNDVRDFNALK